MWSHRAAPAYSSHLQVRRPSLWPLLPLMVLPITATWNLPGHCTLSNCFVLSVALEYEMCERTGSSTGFSHATINQEVRDATDSCRRWIAVETHEARQIGIQLSRKCLIGGKGRPGSYAVSWVHKRPRGMHPSHPVIPSSGQQQGRALHDRTSLSGIRELDVSSSPAE